MDGQKSIKLGFSVGFQIQYCLVVAAIFIIANILLYLLMNKALSGSYLESLRTLYFLDQNLPFYLTIMALLLTCFILILTLVITLLVSHRIAGPVFRYEAVLSQIASGEFPPHVATRDSDQLKPMVDSLNELSSKCRDTFEKGRVLSELIERGPDDLNFADDGKLFVLRQKITDVRSCMGDIAPKRSAE